MKTILSMLIIGLLVLLAWREWTRPSLLVADPEIIITYVYDSIPYTVVVEKPYPVFVEQSVIPQQVDTAAILGSYMAKNYYSDTLVNDEDLYFQLCETIYQNQIQQRTFTYINRRPLRAEVQADCPSSPIPQKLFVGAQAGGGSGVFGAGPSAAWLSRSTLFCYHYDMINDRHQVSVLIRLGGKKLQH